MKSPFSSERLFFGSKQVEVNDLLIGQSTFADFDLDGRNDHVLPVCTKDDCSATARFYFWHQAGNCWSNWTLNLTDPNPGGQTWSFVDPASPLSTVKGSAQVGVETMTFRPGDFSRDGYVDLIGVLQNGSRPENRFAFLLENRPCMHASEAGVTRQLSLGKRTEEPCDETEPRLFEVLWTPLAGQSRATTTGFLDLSEDGTLDTFVEALDGASKPLVIFVESDEKGDTCFLRAQVFTGRCAQQTCPLGREGSGVTLPGACLYYESVDPDGHKRKGTDCQLTQSTHRALQLPYALFGLGQSPNFVDFLTVAVPDRRPQNRSFPQIVPNSRLYVIPHPTNDPSEWIYRLYVTPSRLILLSFATLSCVCGVILFIIVVLQIQEKRADKRERLQEAHKFHFDAM